MLRRVVQNKYHSSNYVGINGVGVVGSFSLVIKIYSGSTEKWVLLKILFLKQNYKQGVEIYKNRIMPGLPSMEF